MPRSGVRGCLDRRAPVQHTVRTMGVARDIPHVTPAGAERSTGLSDLRPTPWEAVARFSLRNLLIAVVAALIVGGVAGAFVATGQATWRAQATLLIDQPQALTGTNDPGVVNKLNLLRLKYATLAVTPLVTRPVAQRLGIAPGEVARSL